MGHLLFDGEDLTLESLPRLMLIDPLDPYVVLDLESLRGRTVTEGGGECQ